MLYGAAQAGLVPKKTHEDVTFKINNLARCSMKMSSCLWFISGLSGMEGFSESAYTEVSILH